MAKTQLAWPYRVSIVECSYTTLPHSIGCRDIIVVAMEVQKDPKDRHGGAERRSNIVWISSRDTTNNRKDLGGGPKEDRGAERSIMYSM